MNFIEKILTFVRSWKTTLAGIVPMVVAVLVGLGILDVDGQEVAGAIDGTLEGVVSTLEAIIATIAAAVGLIGIFSKDGDKKSEDVMAA